jgi:hypothetical protein
VSLEEHPNREHRYFLLLSAGADFSGSGAGVGAPGDFY